MWFRRNWPYFWSSKKIITKDLESSNSNILQFPISWTSYWFNKSVLTCLAMTSEPFRITITLKSFVARPMLTARFFKTGWTIQTRPTDVTSAIVRCLTFAIVTAISTNRLRTWMQWIFIFLRFFPTRLADDITTAIAEITTSSLKSKN